MISFDEAGEMLDELALELPMEFYRELNGGVNLLPDVKTHPASINNDLYTMGEYHCERDLGKYINIYYGSVERVYGHLGPNELKKKLREILIHEFTHHLETLAGERGLIIKDAVELGKYLRRSTQD